MNKNKIIRLAELIENYEEHGSDKFHKLSDYVLSKNIEQMEILAKELDALKFIQGIGDVEAYVNYDIVENVAEKYMKYVDVYKYRQALLKDKYISFLPERIVIYEGNRKEVIDMFRAEKVLQDIKNEIGNEMEMC